MKKIFIVATLTLLAACNLDSVIPTAQESIIPTQKEVAAGLIENLVMGMSKGSDLLSAKDGFFGNELIKIPFPEEATKVKNALMTVGAGKLVQDTTLSLNRAAEDASGVAKEVLVTAIKAITFQDAMNILLGPDNAATTYLQNTTSELLLSKFKPIIGSSLDKVHATKYWGDVMTKYNQINIMNVFGDPVETDLTNYVASRALSAMFLMVEKEEKNIRDNPIERTTNLLKKVFGYADSKKATS